MQLIQGAKLKKKRIFHKGPIAKCHKFRGQIEISHISEETKRRRFRTKDCSSPSSPRSPPRCVADSPARLPHHLETTAWHSHEQGVKERRRKGKTGERIPGKRTEKNAKERTSKHIEDITRENRANEKTKKKKHREIDQQSHVFVSSRKNHNNNKNNKRPRARTERPEEEKKKQRRECTGNHTSSSPGKLSPLCSFILFGTVGRCAEHASIINAPGCFSLPGLWFRPGTRLVPIFTN